MTTETKLPAPPYVGFRTFANFIEWLAEVGVPTRVDRSFWGQKLNGANGMQLMAALRFLGLLDDDNRPMPMLEQLAGNPDERKAALRNLLQTSYAPAIDGLDLSRASAGELQERFRRYPVTGETSNKILAFFINAAQYAEIPLSPHILRAAKGGPRPRSTAGGSTSKKQTGNTPKGSNAGQTPPPPPPPPPDKPPVFNLHPAVAAMLRDLEMMAPNWTASQKTGWEAAFKTMLEYAYPTKEEEA